MFSNAKKNIFFIKLNYIIFMKLKPTSDDR